ncbi:competence protein CoiA family protein [Aurantiacibacter xanthus]|uniref:competence protein CoiA family protein n=1 Tax=Aurantiacibacter xanthus TaxID=1784712 RepID=UPI001749C81D|nr:competence protein CoiA family protein [Aurantiacibacter xanthus]
MPFARCNDGVARHVDKITGKSMGPFRCLDCDELLQLRISIRARPHFAHLPDSRCAGETALHVYAKELLQREQELTFTPLVLRKEGLEEVVFEGGRFKLDNVIIEVDRSGFRPDAIVALSSKEFAVEFKVAHAVDDAKQEKVAADDIPMIEIDLNSLRFRQISMEELDDAILHSADRKWIHHPERANGQARLESRVAAKKAERGRRLKFHIERKPRGNVDYDYHRESLAALEDAGLLDAIGIPVDCQHWFCVGLPVWQAAVLATCIVAPSRTYTPGARIKVCGDWPDYQGYANRLPDWMIRKDLSPYHWKRLEEAGYSTSSFGNADHAVFYYLAHLAATQEIVAWDRDEEAFFVTSELHGRVYRLHELGWKIRRVLEAAGAPDPNEVKARWLHKYNVDGASPAEIASTGGATYDLLLSRVDALVRMADSYYNPVVVDDLCGLPLEPMRQKRLTEIEEQNAKLAQAKAVAALARLSDLENSAREGLGPDARAWLSQNVADPAQPIREWASETDGNLAQAFSFLRKAIRERNARLAAADAVQNYQRQLEEAARKAYPDKTRAGLFVSSWRAKCDSPSALRSILEKLPKTRR